MLLNVFGSFTALSDYLILQAIVMQWTTAQRNIFIYNLSSFVLLQCCETAMMSLGLEPHINKRTINLSAGNKRKLSTAVAILGDPALVLMVSHAMNSMKLVIPLHLISWKKTPNDAVTPQCQSQFTPKMKANAVPRLLSSLVWIDQYNEYNI